MYNKLCIKVLITLIVINNAVAFVPDPLTDFHQVGILLDRFEDVGYDTEVTTFPAFTRTIRYGIDGITPGLFQSSWNRLEIRTGNEIRIGNRPNSNTTVEFIYDYPPENYQLINTDIHIQVNKLWTLRGLAIWVNFTTVDDETFEYEFNDFSDYAPDIEQEFPSQNHILTVFLQNETYVIKQYVFGFSNTFYGPTVNELYPGVLIAHTTFKFIPNHQIEALRTTTTNYLLYRETEVIPYTKYGNLAVDTLDYYETGFEMDVNTTSRRFIVKFPPKVFKKSPRLFWDQDSFNPAKNHVVEFGYLTGDGTFITLATWRKNRVVNTLPIRKIRGLTLDNFCLIIKGAGTLLNFYAN